MSSKEMWSSIWKFGSPSIHYFSSNKTEKKLSNIVKRRPALLIQKHVSLLLSPAGNATEVNLTFPPREMCVYPCPQAENYKTSFSSFFLSPLFLAAELACEHVKFTNDPKNENWSNILVKNTFFCLYTLQLLQEDNTINNKIY